MSYDSESPTPARRRLRGNLVIATAALVPTALAGWLVWQAMGGSGGQDDKPPRVLPLPSGPAVVPSGNTRPPTVTVTATPSPSVSPSVAPSTQSARPTGPLAGRVVVIDPGHNPSNFEHAAEINRQVDIGTNKKECDTTGTDTKGGYTEAAFTLDVSHRLRALLEKLGATVTYTQDNDRPFGPCVDERAAIGNRAKADAVVSVHADGAAEGQRGFHVILPALVNAGKANTAPIVAPSRELGVRIAGKFVHATGMPPSNYVGDGTALDVRKDLGGLNLSTVPKVFIECGNMRDSGDAALLTNADWRQKAAQGIADGISSFLQK
ncbi:N-acetylmuramoyl-L-alanine amidase [Streptomyces sp. TLI_146]|uniref:N-acetylmuramoyl-L-alanine amidase n=1 Tax=Streptomyces sp. TLI_146 TaxID=1938858 RepID=UPI000C70EC2B|nr:N-acetylmuramoyl-L-alanine amidase [Streptomyces sp. TLI_146]PKV85495.1 N-acetylmuramoyl-L-alanine amidase [Streptomyces sp. TLI_146]